MSESRQFHLGDILSITTDKLVSTRHIEGIYDILNFLTGDNLYTHQLPRASDECKPYILSQLPQLAEVDASSVNQETWKTWLREQETRFGSYLTLSQMPANRHLKIDPVKELESMVGEDRVIVVDISEVEERL